MPRGPKRRGGKSTLGARVTRCRLRRGWTQHELAKRVTTSQAVIQRIETGKCRHPRILDELAVALAVSPAWLMFGVEVVEGLDDEALEVARVWASLPEPHRRNFREIIMNGGVARSAAA